MTFAGGLCDRIKQSTSATPVRVKFRIVNATTLSLSQKGMRKQAQAFNNRNLERLFTRFDSVKFFLTRDHLREVIVRR